MIDLDTNPIERGPLAAAQSEPTAAGVRRPSTPGLRAARITGAALAAALLLTSPASPAQEQTGEQAGSDVNWSDWNLLGGGYVGRRLEPPNMHLPPEQRRLPTTQPKAGTETTPSTGETE